MWQNGGQSGVCSAELCKYANSRTQQIRLLSYREVRWSQLRYLTTFPSKERFNRRDLKVYFNSKFVGLAYARMHFKAHWKCNLAKLFACKAVCWSICVADGQLETLKVGGLLAIIKLRVFNFQSHIAPNFSLGPDVTEQRNCKLFMTW